MSAIELTDIAFKHAPWGGDTGDGDLVIWDTDWSTATFLWQFGSPTDLAVDISLTNASEGAQGVFAAYDDEYVHPTSGATGAATLIRPTISEATLEGLTYSTITDLPLAFTLYVTPLGGQKRVLANGTLTVKQGVADV